MTVRQNPQEARAAEQIGQAIGRLKDRRQQMEDANAALTEWGPIRAVPALLKLGLNLATVQRVTVCKDGSPVGFTAQDLAAITGAIQRLEAISCAEQLNPKAKEGAEGYVFNKARH